MTRSPLATDSAGLRLVLLLYLVLSLTTLMTWTVQRNNTITGDEPWYLVQTDGIVRDGQLAFETPMQREIAEKRFYPSGFPPYNPAHPAASHAVAGPNGIYSFHNPGLSVLLVPPVALGDAIGQWLRGTEWGVSERHQAWVRALPELLSRVWLLLLNGVGLIVACWQFSGRYLGDRPGWRTASVAALALGLPLLPAASQIYPDLPGGVLSLLLLYWVFTVEVPRRTGVQVLYVLGLLALPWLHIRFSLPAGILALGLFWRGWALQVPWVRCFLPGVLLGLSGLGLAAYNLYAYGHPVSSFGPGFMQYNLTTLLVFVGLNIDQNQGALLQQPLLWLGLAGLALLWRDDRRSAIVLIVVYFALIMPTAAHVAAPYGGWSFSGRFGWAAGFMLLVPTFAALGILARRAPRVTALLLAAAMLLQFVRYLGYTWWLDRGILFNRFGDMPDLPSLDGYPIFQPWLALALPFFIGPRDVVWEWTLRYAPNLAFMACLVIALLAGRHLVANGPHSIVRFGRDVLVCLVVIGVGWALRSEPQGLGAPPAAGTVLSWSVARLPGTTGTSVPGGREALPGRDTANHLLFDARRYLGLEKTYRLTLVYSAAAPADAVVAELELFSAPIATVLASYPLPGTDGEVRQLAVEYTAPLQSREVELRVFWRAEAPLQVQGLSIQTLTDTP